MQHWVIGDIHGCFYTLTRLIDKIYNEGKEPFTFIFVGDLIDRGKYSREVVNLVRLLVEKELAICLKGNHEQLAIYSKKYSSETWQWIRNGGNTCLDSYKGYEDVLESDIEWFDTLPTFHEIDNWFIVHAGVNPDYYLDDQVDEDILWIRGKFHNSDKFHCKQDGISKRIMFGHTPLEDVIIQPNYVGIDTGCVYGKKLTAYCLETNKIVQLDKQEEDGVF